MLRHKLRVISQFHAYAVVFRDRSGRIIRRGIFSEERPTIGVFKGRHAVQTDCVATAHSRKSLDRAIALLHSKLGPGWVAG